jgi:putative endonuclease
MSRKDRFALGTWGEDLAIQVLKKQGYQFIERNYSLREGEIDLIMQDGETIVFVEVKTRTSNAFGSPEDSLNQTKFKRIETAGRTYLLERKLEEVDWRIDLIAIVCTQKLVVERLDHYKLLECPEE